MIYMYLTIDIADPLGTSYLHMSQPERWLLYFLPKPQPMSVFCHKERERERVLRLKPTLIFKV